MKGAKKMDEVENKNILTIKEFSLRTGLSVKAIRKLIIDHKLVFIKTTQKFYIDYAKSMEILWNR